MTLLQFICAATVPILIWLLVREINAERTERARVRRLSQHIDDVIREQGHG